MTTLPCCEFAWSSDEVPWPTPQDYNEAIQNPAYAFSDPELQTGSCEVTALGLPKPITGNFASVYRLHCTGRDWAVRCFWRELSDMQLRYRAISAHLASAGLPYTVGFEYQPQGIRIRGAWYPILKMEWVEGELLNDYLVAHLMDPVTLQSLMESWVRMVSDLERSGCAHGDLQHGNVLVVNGELKLVDYDGMFVPALLGMGSHELGQQHYQHPQRTGTDFGPQLDRFSSWVIYLSIAAVRVDPSLWSSTQAGDERLLLQRKDFEQPASSPSLALLANHADSGLQALAHKFRDTLQDSVTAVPSLAASLRQNTAGPILESHQPSRVPRRLRLICRRVVPSSSARGLPREEPLATFYPVWVIDHLPAPRDLCIAWSESQVRASRLISLASLPIGGVGGIALLAISAPVALALVMCILVWAVLTVVGCLVAYRRDPTVRTLLPQIRVELQALAAISQSERERRKLDSQVARLVQRGARAREEAARRTHDLQHRADTELATLRAELTMSLDSIDTRIRDVDRREIEETEQVLAALQGRYIAQTLRAATLRRAAIPGIDLPTKMRLWTMGVWAAADVSSERIRTMQHLNHDHLIKIVSWRVGTETEARRAMPRQIPAERKHTLHRKYGSERLDLVAERTRQEAAARAAMEEVQASLALKHGHVEDRLTQILQDAAQLRSALEAQIELLRARELEYQSIRSAALQRMPTYDVEFRAFMRVVWLPWM
jgi:hypothetical protein